MIPKIKSAQQEMNQEWPKSQKQCKTERQWVALWFILLCIIPNGDKIHCLSTQHHGFFGALCSKEMNQDYAGIMQIV